MARSPGILRSVSETRERLLELVDDDPLARELVPILTLPTGTSSAGRPFLKQRSWEAFRDRIPHLFLLVEVRI